MSLCAKAWINNIEKRTMSDCNKIILYGYCMYSHMGCRLVISAVWQPLITFFLHCMEMSSTNIRQNLFFSVLWMILSHTGLKQHQGEYMMTGCSFLDETWNMIWWPKRPTTEQKKENSIQNPQMQRFTRPLQRSKQDETVNVFC